jgi:hydrogenase maturation protease
MTERKLKPVLVIGYGSSLRGDDAVGRLVVDWIADRGLANVVTKSVTQLVPELAAEIARSRAVIFADACVPDCGQTVELQELTASSGAHGATHSAAPSQLLALTRACYGGSPSAWLVLVPAVDFEFTEQISSIARNNVNEAARVVERLIIRLEESEVAHA